mgnify:CR=1 FL=1
MTNTAAKQAQDQAQTVYRKDYTPPPFLVENTELDFRLDENKTRVRARFAMRRNPKAMHQDNLTLDGKDMTLIGASLDGEPLSGNQYKDTPESLTVFDVPEAFTLETEVEINPAANTALEGLYRDSGGMLSTQCEAEGFRRITYFPDRPDVLSTFEVRIEGDKKTYPILLSNGNKLEEGETEDGRHFTIWQDPIPKPSYLFALVAGQLESLDDTFTTMSGREVKLQLFTEKHNKHKTPYAMGALKRSMKWDEEKFGREYDLDIFMIVAVDAFNMGAMENKGLNIFNSSAVLASPETSTDDRFLRIEAIVAHEYFHNWSGNRVTCRSWFELSLKEGFTVFRDAEFTSDMNNRAVKRIEDVRFLRATQFPEDASPMAHPIRPDSFQTIDNFYTVTVYEKGAEVIGMYKTILGEENFRKGSDLYFDRHDGQAVTCEDFTKAMEDASEWDLNQFRNWYSQEGTPKVHAQGSYDKSKQTYTLTLRQEVKKGQKPFHIPVKLGLVRQTGEDVKLVTDSASFQADTGVYHLRDKEETLTFTNVAEKPVPSLLRGFSAPVKLYFDYTREELMFLMSNDTDGFNRWEAGQVLAVRVLEDLMQAYRNSKDMEVDPLLVKAFEATLDGALKGKISPALAAETLSLPPQAYVGELQDVIDLEALQTAHEHLRDTLASKLEDKFMACYKANTLDTPYEPTPDQMGPRALQNKCLGYLLHAGHSKNAKLAAEQFAQSSNMTQTFGALQAMVSSPYTEDEAKALDAFYDKWQDDPLVIEMWLSVQSASPQEGTTKKVQALTEHPAFSMKRPNSVRSVVGAYTQSGMRNFHHKSGEGYKWLADKILELDGINPQIAARLLTPLIKFKRYTPKRAQLMKAELERMVKTGSLSKNTFEVASKALEEK